MLKKVSILFISLLMVVTYSLPTYAGSSSDFNPVVPTNIEQTAEDEELTVEPMIAPIIIGIAVRALIQLGRAELARYLQQQGVKAYCSKYGKTGPKYVSDLLCK
ncbi:Uncharacterised protein [Niallia circulans]|jgi:hypothetical protein|uniref:hypothetical protein n=1 Tax=Shouchella clausii TaxID=79880 RepID=UPI000BA6F3C5|nr:hypothetical protein [Shouchella clausii]MCM3548497.1 hypothetical protein [Shouchella clausii]PAF13794.1 hypothetical protein CHH59_12170 [Shouchella clausii]SPT78360.1 Uncharacterised protein [Niallia circulans]